MSTRRRWKISKRKSGIKSRILLRSENVRQTSIVLNAGVLHFGLTLHPGSTVLETKQRETNFQHYRAQCLALAEALNELNVREAERGAKMYSALYRQSAVSGKSVSDRVYLGGRR